MTTAVPYKLRLAILPGLLLGLACGCGRVASDSADSTVAAIQATVQAATHDLTPQARAYADSVMAGMSLEEIASQLLMPASYTRTDAATLRQLTCYARELKVGGIAFHKGDTASMRLIADSLQRLSQTPLFLAIDAENGLGMRLKGASLYPLNYKLSGASQTQMYDYGRTVGRECEQAGINMVFGPVLDVAPGPGWYMYKRSLGPDPQRVAGQATAYARGMQDAGVVPVGKHFPGHGRATADPHTSLPVITATAEEFRKVDLLPFARYIESGLPAMMVAHVAVPALSGDTLPADMSPHIMRTLLRGEMHFDGLIITDAVNMGALRGVDAGGLPPIISALSAGADIILAPDDTGQALHLILQALRTGQLTEACLRDHCRRILFHKYLALHP